MNVKREWLREFDLSQVCGSLNLVIFMLGFVGAQKNVYGTDGKLTT